MRTQIYTVQKLLWTVFIKFQLLRFAGEEMEAQPVLSVSLKATEPGWNQRRNQT